MLHKLRNKILNNLLSKSNLKMLNNLLSKLELSYSQFLGVIT